MKKRTKKSAAVAGCMAAALAITGAFAFLSDSDTDVNRFSFADKDGEQTVDVELIEPHWDEKNGENILPGETVAKDPQIVNEGENDVYGFITVLVPTAKSIKLNKMDGTQYDAADVELFHYEINDGWAEVAATDKGDANTQGDKIATDASITNKASLGANDNIYYTAHTYAYAGDAMTRLASGETTASSVFANLTPVDGGDELDGGVKMINIADGAQSPKTLDMVYAELEAEDGTTLLKESGKIRAVTYYSSLEQFIASFVKGDGTKFADTDAAEDAGYSVSDDGKVVKNGQPVEASSKTLYTTVVEGEDDDAVTWVIDANGNKQWKTMSQIKADDNINIYVTSYAVQADNLATDDIDEVWGICANTSADVQEGSTLSNDFYFAPIAADPGQKGTPAA